MSRGLVATASTEVQAPPNAVWEALVDPEMVKQYMLGTEVVSDWKKGSPIVWKGEYEGQDVRGQGPDPGDRAGAADQLQPLQPAERRRRTCPRATTP